MQRPTLDVSLQDTFSELSGTKELFASLSIEPDSWIESRRFGAGAPGTLLQVRQRLANSRSQAPRLATMERIDGSIARWLNGSVTR